MNWVKWLNEYDGYVILNSKIHDWYFIDSLKDYCITSDSINPMPIYFVKCNQCNMRGVVDRFYLIFILKKNESYSCKEFLIKNIIE